jgi:GR25 family glycosyltransferase involved in LPS biosynthesis
MGLLTQRFPAIANANGAIGCSMSHIACLELAIKNNWEHVLICEDDATIINPGQLVYQFNQFLKRNGDNWDVLLLAGNNYQRRPYFETLLNNFKKGLNGLIETNIQETYAIDQYWKELQRIHRWYLIIPVSVIQRSDYSDICKRHVNYTKEMTTVNKKWYGK